MPTRRPGASRRLSRTDRRRQQDRLAIIIGAVLLVLVVGLVVAMFLTKPTVTGKDGCVAGQITPTVHTLILLDETDPFTPTELAYTNALILAEYQRLHLQDKLTVSFIDADPVAPTRVFARCRVQLGSAASGVYNNPAMIQMKYDRIVGNDLGLFIKALASVPPAQKSPILETIDGVLELPDFGLNVPSRRLVILSDMAQNSDQFSQYGAKGGAATLPPDVASALGREELRGVDVRVHYLRRTPLARLQTAQHKAFWRRWFEGQGAKVQLGWGLQLVDGPAPAK